MREWKERVREYCIWVCLCLSVKIKEMKATTSLASQVGESEIFCENEWLGNKG